MQCLEQNITRYDAYCTAKEAKHFMILQLLSHLAAQLPPDSTVVDIGAASHDHAMSTHVLVSPAVQCMPHVPCHAGTLHGLSALALVCNSNNVTVITCVRTKLVVRCTS